MQRLNGLMQFARIFIEERTVIEQFCQFTQVRTVRVFLFEIQVCPDAVDDFLLIGLIVMQGKAEIIQSRLTEASQYHFKRRRFLRNKQHLFPVRQCLGNDIGNGLAFACSRRALHDEAGSPFGKKNRLFLTGIRVDNFKSVFRPQRVEIDLVRPGREIRQGLPVTGHGPQHRVAEDPFLVVVEVMVHADLQEGKQSEANLMDNPPAVPVRHLLHPGQVLLNGFPVLQVKGRKLDVIQRVKQVAQRGIDFNFIFIVAQGIRGTEGLAPQRHGHHEQRRLKPG